LCLCGLFLAIQTSSKSCQVNREFILIYRLFRLHLYCLQELGICLRVLSYFIKIISQSICDICLAVPDKTKDHPQCNANKDNNECPLIWTSIVSRCLRNTSREDKLSIFINQSQKHKYKNRRQKYIKVNY